LQRLFTYYDEWERSMRAYRRRRLVTGSTGQPKLNDLGKFCLELESKIERLEDKLGITPMARMRLGIAFGEARKTLEEINREVDEGIQEADDPRLAAD
jgi:hypothetical protein